MAIFGNLFDTFSTRPEAMAKRKRTVPERTRTRIVMLCREIFSNERYPSGYIAEFWDQIHRLLRYRNGRMQFAEGNPRSVAEDAVHYVMMCPGDEFLDFIGRCNAGAGGASCSSATALSSPRNAYSMLWTVSTGFSAFNFAL